MDILNVPQTATEKYYERLAENIQRRIKEARSRRDKERLELMLQEVRKRMLSVQEAPEPEPEQPSAEASSELLLTDAIEEESDVSATKSLWQPRDIPSGVDDQATPREADELLLTEVVAEGDEVSSEEMPLAEGQIGHPESGPVGNEESDVLLLTDIIEEVEEETIDEDQTLSENEREIVKERLKGILGRFQDRRHQAPKKQADQVLSEVMQEITEEAPLARADFSKNEQDKIKDRLKLILETFKAESHGPSLLNAGTELLLEEIDLVKDHLKNVQISEEAVIPEGGQISPPGSASSPQTFTEICEKVGQGEPLSLLQNIPLSERERNLVQAFMGHLSSYKGLKKQQAFEMQHLTARSIRELDLIFKTYHIDGYLKAELHNVYNRLLNLRSRFSVLQH
jgi:hypothetical protein